MHSTVCRSCGLEPASIYVYWQCEVGETTQVSDFVDGSDVLSREGGPSEVRWSYTAPMAWPVIAQTFNLPLDGPGSVWGGGGAAAAATGGSGGGCVQTGVLLLVIGVVLLLCMFGSCGSCMGGASTGGYRGGGVYYGGK